MAIFSFDNIAITGMAACVPRNISHNSALAESMTQQEVDKVINSIGVREKRFVSDGVTPADLCCKAAEQLLEQLEIDRNSIDVLIFMSQSPDHKIPATSPWLQAQLGLPTSTACFDVSLACSGYVYALSTAFAYANIPGVQRVLLLDGEAFSRIVNPKDKVNAPLYGDAGTATLIEKGKSNNAWFALYTDGSGQDAIKIKAGGARCPVTEESIQVREREDGNMRADTEVYMDGLEVFNFTLKVVPKMIREILEQSGKDLNEIDSVVFHQANRFMIEFFVKKLRIPPERVPFSLDRFGNVSSATIPLTIVSELRQLVAENKKQLLMAGFGAGLSWGSTIQTFDHCRVLPLIEI